MPNLEWPKSVPLLDSWKILSDSQRKEALFTIYKVRSYVDLFRWMVIVDPIDDRDVRMGVLREVNFFRKIYLAALRHQGSNEMAEESENGEQFDGWDDEVFAMPDPIEWESLSESQQNMALGYINETIYKHYKLLEVDLVKEKPIPDFEKVMDYIRFCRFIFKAVNALRELVAGRDNSKEDFSYCLSDYEKYTPVRDMNNENFAKNREAWSKIMNGDY